MTTIDKVKQFCVFNNLTDIGDSILLGLSGGADSVCLLFILYELREELGISISAVHVNHCIRGEEADRDELFCRNLADRLGVPFKSVRVDVPAIAKAEGLSCEEAGRKVRYEIFNTTAVEMGCNKICVAHHMNDSAETFLFQLFRGSRLNGLSGIRPMNGNVIRPLLCLTRNDIEEYLEDIEESYVTDSTNLSEDYSRNLIRNTIFKEAEKIQPRVISHISDTASYISKVTAFMDRMAENVYKDTTEETGTDEISISIPKLKEADPLLAEMVVYKAICKVAGRKKDITSEFVESCIALMEKQSGRSLNLKYSVTATRVYERLVIKKDSPFDISSPNCNNELIIHEIALPEGLSAAEYIKKQGGFPDGKNEKIFDADKLKEIIGENRPKLVTISPEDMITVYSDGRKKRAWDVLTEAKVPENERFSRQVVSADHEVLMIPGLRGSEACRVDETTRNIMIITIQEA